MLNDNSIISTSASTNITPTIAKQSVSEKANISNLKKTDIKTNKQKSLIRRLKSAYVTPLNRELQTMKEQSKKYKMFNLPHYEKGNSMRDRHENRLTNELLDALDNIEYDRRKKHADDFEKRHKQYLAEREKEITENRQKRLDFVKSSLSHKIRQRKSGETVVKPLPKKGL
ncbi:hypothetical protein AB837_00397 [bacterium AB1]|nr:hypothetical protein AB837_00397 [bacterium AB1]